MQISCLVFALDQSVEPFNLTNVGGASDRPYGTQFINTQPVTITAHSRRKTCFGLPLRTGVRMPHVHTHAGMHTGNL